MSQHPITMFDPTRHYREHKKEYDEALTDVMNSGRFINGPQVKELEEQLCEYTGAKHCVGVSSGTDALLIALMALGVGPGDEVVTVPFTWISTAEVICLLGATPVFCDIDPDTYNMSPSSLTKVLTPKTKVVMPVSLFGHMYDVDGVKNVVEGFESKVLTKIYIVEDAAQSFGATDIDGNKSCSVADISCTSFFPTKPLGGCGDGGACFTNDPEFDRRIRSIRNHGCLKRYQYEFVGVNGRLDTLQAALLKVKLKYLDESLEKRIANAAIYDEELKDCNVGLPKLMNTGRHVYAQYTLKFENEEKRDLVKDSLKSNGIHTGVFYPVCLHLVDCLNEVTYDVGSLPVSEDLATRVLSIPVYPELAKDEVGHVVKTLKELAC
jgi:UDP-2-acetamido-2-deoxy-ribo-hexuluronate aminotransferase